jgi:hypothetical protein
LLRSRRYLHLIYIVVVRFEDSTALMLSIHIFWVVCCIAGLLIPDILKKYTNINFKGQEVLGVILRFLDP